MKSWASLVEGAQTNFKSCESGQRARADRRREGLPHVSLLVGGAVPEALDHDVQHLNGSTFQRVQRINVEEPEYGLRSIIRISIQITFIMIIVGLPSVSWLLFPGP